MTMDIQTKTFEAMDRHIAEGNLLQMPDRDYCHAMTLQPGPNTSQKPGFWKVWGESVKIVAVWFGLFMGTAAFWIALFWPWIKRFFE